MVTAAFIGPGTVITASLAGANFGYALLWAILFSVLATIILQEMTARLGIVTGKGLGENIRANLKHPLLRALSILMVVSALIIGNAAYQGGNISGASLGLSALAGDLAISSQSINNQSINFWPLIIGSIAFFLLWRGSFKLVEKSLMVLVGLMSVAFLVTFLLTRPDIGALFSGLLLPVFPEGATLTIIALIGTTVVPYNLFLHAASVSQEWKHPEDLGKARKDLFIAIPVGGLISIAIVSTAAAAFFGKQIQLSSAADLAPALEPLFGEWAKVFMALGLFAAGISSAITAPLASAYALSGILNLNNQLNSLPFRIVWIVILLVGVTIASAGYRPVTVIWFAQVANGILLPIVCIFLLWLMNQPILKEHRNGTIQNILGFIVLAVTLVLSARSLMSAFGLL